MSKRCPFYGFCNEECCQWWRAYANDCAIGVLVDILADSKISLSCFDGKEEND